MNNWRLLLLAVVAVLQPIGSFTEQYLIDGQQECCDHGSEIRDNLYGTFRKDVHDQRLTSRLTDRPDVHENRRYETGSPLLRRSVERGVTERRFLADRERFSRHHDGRQREYSESTNLERSRIHDSRYERASFVPTRHVSVDASRLSRDLSRDNRDAGSERRMREIRNQARNIRSVQNRDDNRINERTDQRRERETKIMSEDRVASRIHESNEPSLEPQRAINLARKTRSVQSRNEDKTNERVEQRQERDTNRMSDDRVASRLREFREQRLEPQRAINLVRNIRSVQSRIEDRSNERVEHRQERDTNRMSDDRVASRLREFPEQRLEPQRAINLVRNIRSVQNRDDNSINERAEQRRGRETNRISNERVVSRLLESREQRQKPQRVINLTRNVRSEQKRDENRVNERAEQRRERETTRISDDVSRQRESREQRLEPQRAINLARNIRSIQSRDDNRFNERADQRRELDTTRKSDDRVVSRLRESREQRQEKQRVASLSRNIRSVRIREDNRINERGDQRRERETSRMTDDRVASRLRESREQRQEPQRAASVSRNIRSVRISEDNRINEREDQRRERETSRMTGDRVVSRLRESREQRQEPQRAASVSRNIRSVQSRDDNRINEREDQRQERETFRMSEDRVASRLRESGQSPEQRLESHRFVRQSRDIRSDQSRYEDRVNERREQIRDTNRMSEERLMSRLSESRQDPQERLKRRTKSPSRIDNMRNRQEATRRQSNMINKRSEDRERNIRDSRDRMTPENRDLIRDQSRISRSSERNDEQLLGPRRVSAERRQDAHRVSRIVPARDSTERNVGERNRDFSSSQREVTRDQKSVERADSRRQIEVNRERTTREVTRNFEEQRSRSALPSTLRDVRNERYRAVSNRDREIQRELKSERFESEIRLKSSDMVMERIDRARESRNRIQRDRISTVRETLIQDKSKKLSIDMDWQYLFYTLQGAYLCGLLVQILTEKSMKSKTSNFSWWNPLSNNLIKVD